MAGVIYRPEFGKLDSIQQSIVVILLDILQRSPAMPLTEIVRHVDDRIRILTGKTIDNRIIANRLNQFLFQDSPLRVRLMYNSIRIGLKECIIVTNNRSINSIPKDRIIREYWIKARSITFDGKIITSYNIPYEYKVRECEGNDFTENPTPGLDPNFIIEQLTSKLLQSLDPMQALYEAHKNENLTLEPGQIPSTFSFKIKMSKSIDIIDLIALSMGEMNLGYMYPAIKLAIENIKKKKITRGDNKQILNHLQHVESLANGGRVIFTGNGIDSIAIVLRVYGELVSEPFRILKNYMYTSKILYNSNRNEMLAIIIIPVSKTIKNESKYAVMYARNIVREFADLAGIDHREIEYYTVSDTSKYGIPYMN
ncbi:MAG: hypothetical protein F7C37_01035, partial [Desulfurococcales archaeon]|nr:hypothetical protein [Desulfurococcales archaeon]